MDVDTQRASTSMKLGDPVQRARRGGRWGKLRLQWEMSLLSNPELVREHQYTSVVDIQCGRAF